MTAFYIVCQVFLKMFSFCLSCQTFARLIDLSDAENPFQQGGFFSKKYGQSRRGQSYKKFTVLELYCQECLSLIT